MYQDDSGNTARTITDVIGDPNTFVVKGDTLTGKLFELDKYVGPSTNLANGEASVTAAIKAIRDDIGLGGVVLSTAAETLKGAINELHQDAAGAQTTADSGVTAAGAAQLKANNNEQTIGRIQDMLHELAETGEAAFRVHDTGAIQFYVIEITIHKS